VTCPNAAGAESQFRQVTTRRLFSTPLLQLRTDQPDEALSCARQLAQLRLFTNTHLEFELLQPACQSLLKPKPMVLLWEFNFVAQMCAKVIQASSKKDRPERLVIAYHDEQTLRDLIAAPSIIGLGFASREEAIANCERRMSTATPLKQKTRITAMFHATHEDGDFPTGHGLLKHRRIPQSILQSALAPVIALFYSKNIVSVMIRMALGASF